MSLSLIGAVGFLGWLGYRYWRHAPRTLGSGEFKLIDHQDGPLTVVAHGVGMVLATGVAFGVLVLLRNGVEAHERIWMGALDMGVWVFVLLAFWSGLRDVRAGAPGELRLPCHPLPAGRTVTVKYLRRLKRPDSLGSVCAELVLYHNERDGKTTHRERCQVIHLGDGDGRLHNGAIKAAWTFRVPDPAGGETRGLWSPFAALVQVVNAYEWVLEVKTPLGTLVTADSCFLLPVVAAGGEVDEAPGAVRRAG